MNQAETEAMAAGFKTLGWKIAEFGEKADAVVLNTCTVTDNADAKSRASMNRARRIPGIGEKKPLIIITGCYVNSHWDELQSGNGVYYVDNARKNRIPQLVEAHFQGEIMTGHFEEGRDPFAYPAVCPVFRTRAMVKIQDGCDNFCTFCIIPFVRGGRQAVFLRKPCVPLKKRQNPDTRKLFLPVSIWPGGQTAAPDSPIYWKHAWQAREISASGWAHWSWTALTVGSWI